MSKAETLTQVAATLMAHLLRNTDTTVEEDRRWAATEAVALYNAVVDAEREDREASIPCVGCRQKGGTHPEWCRHGWTK